MDNTYRGKKTLRTAGIHKLIANVENSRKRNLLRGYSAKPQLSSKDIESIRRGNPAHDSVLLGQY